MFKRVLLLTVLMAVMVVPGAAYVDLYDNFDSLSSDWATFKNIYGTDQTSCSDGILNLYTHSTSQMGHHYKVYPESMDLPFTFHVRVKPASSDSIQLLNQLGISSSQQARGYGVKITSSATKFTIYDARATGDVVKGTVSFIPENDWVTLHVSVTDDKKLYVSVDDANYTYIYTVPSSAFYPAYGVTAPGMSYTGIPAYAYYDWVAIDPVDPNPDPNWRPVDKPVLRTGTVTMTDNNGTTITGFEVTADNIHTNQSYTVETESDFAVMTLPMDRVITIRNPQTGEYEDTLVGLYRFSGQSPGYKMVDDEGIQVSVMPEKYTSYELCDIRVTPESGPLTGKHLFQIRSRSDNSVLQTGTVSAKSATTGEWFNTTVSGGIASLILPYDTSNSISQYAGNYYVYATSPGYEDSDYGKQIVVMPHTVSEIRDVHLTPIGGIPTPGNVTLRIQAFSETGPGVVNAEIFIAGVLGEGSSVWDTYTASSTGYLAVSVPGNSTYDIVASGAGYYDSARRVEVLTEDPPLIEIKLYLSGTPTVEPTEQPTGWPTEQPTGQPTGGIPDDDDGSGGFLMEAVRGIGLTFGVGFATAKLILGMLLALAIGMATAKQLKGGAQEFGIGLMGGTLLGVLIGLLPVWIIVVLLLVVGLYIGNRYVGGNNG